MSEFSKSLSLLRVCALLFVTGCSSTGEITPSKPVWDRTTKLEIPPDLTTPEANAGSEQYSAAALNASKAELDQYEQFESFQQMADFKDFLEWREKHSANLDLSLEAFRSARDQQIATALTEQGVLTITTRDGQRVLLVDDTLDSTWDRLRTAANNMGLQVISERPEAGQLNVHYGTESPEESSGWQTWIPWLSDPIIYAVTLELTRSGPAVSIQDAEGAAINTELSNSFVDRLGVQLLTFAEQVDSAEAASSAVMQAASLEEMPSGHLTLIVQGSAGGVWRVLERKLQDTEFSIAERSSESLTFLIRYDDPKKLAEKSWTQSLAFWRDDESAPAEDILLVLTPTGTETRVDALDSQESQSDIGDQVLRILEESFLKN